jgi:hypothetical protein
LNFRPAEDNPVSSHDADVGQRHAGVSTRCLDECVAGLDIPSLFGSSNHAPNRSIFDRDGIEHLEFGDQPSRGVRSITSELDKRRPADEIGNKRPTPLNCAQNKVTMGRYKAIPVKLKL